MSLSERLEACGGVLRHVKRNRNHERVHTGTVERHGTCPAQKFQETRHAVPGFHLFRKAKTSSPRDDGHVAGGPLTLKYT